MLAHGVSRGDRGCADNLAPEGRQIMAHTFTNLLTHVIFSTKNRVPSLDAEVRERLFPYMGGIVSNLKGKPILINGPADHVHVLAVLPATAAPSEFMCSLKSNSSGWVHETWPTRADFGWQTGYGAFSVSMSNLQDVKHYIAIQEEHHRKVAFKEEFVLFLRKHGIEYDERYIWEAEVTA